MRYINIDGKRYAIDGAASAEGIREEYEEHKSHLSGGCVSLLEFCRLKGVLGKEMDTSTNAKRIGTHKTKPRAGKRIRGY